jgi:dihydropyrimidinase
MSADQPTVDTLITGGTLVTADAVYPADIGISDGKIRWIGRSGDPADAREHIDATGRLVIPGGVDPHVHLEATSQGQRTADDFTSGTAAAVLGGTTTVIDFAYQQEGLSLAESIAERRALAEGFAVTDFGFHLVLKHLDEAHLSELRAVVADGTCSFKIYLAYPRRGLMADDATLFRALDFARQLGAVCLVHAENGVVNDVLVDRAVAAGSISPAQHELTRPAGSEVEGTFRALALARLAGAAVYFVHVSSADSLAEILRARQRGQAAMGETCIHYLTMDRAKYDLPGFEPAKYVMNPPLRGADDVAALWTALQLGQLQVVSTDHCPFDFIGQKDAGASNFALIPNGVPGIRHRIELLYSEGVARDRISLSQWVSLIATGPARIMGLARKGRLHVGADADIAIFDPDARWRITQASHDMHVDYSVYEGHEVTGRVDHVLRRGEVIVRDRELAADVTRGRYVPRHNPALL